MPDETRSEQRLGTDTEERPDPSEATDADLRPGRRIGEYIVEKAIATGGFGTVYRATHDVLGRPAALKVLHSHVATSAEVLIRFEREARAVNLIRHPNVVDIYDFGRLDDGRPYFVMELLAGNDLETRLTRAGRLSPAEVLGILEPLCGALTVAHEKGIIHRDLKPSNIFLAAEDGKQRVVLLDFGIAKLLTSGDPGLTTARHAIGTPTCMAPEQITNGPVGASTDVYGLGALVFRLLTGDLPFGDETPVMMQYMHLHSAAPLPSGRAPDAKPFDELVVRAMDKKPENRYQSATELLQAFRTAAERAPNLASAASSGPAVGLHLDVLVEDDLLDNPDSALLEDMAAVLPLAAEVLLAQRFVVAMESGTSMLLVRPLSEGGDSAGTRRLAVESAIALAERLDQRTTKDDRVHVNICMHVGRAIVAGARVLGGDLLRLEWVARAPIDGVAGTGHALDGTGVSTVPVPGSSSLFRVQS